MLDLKKQTNPKTKQQKQQKKQTNRYTQHYHSDTPGMA